MIQTAHFLRPWWFIALIPAIIIFIVWVKKVKRGKNNWKEHCDPHLLNHLLTKSNNKPLLQLPMFILFLWIVIIIALSGFTWSQYAQPVYQKNIARVIALDVSQSMNATDILPSRLQRSKYKILDLLHNIKEGQTGMVVFSSAAFVVSPLTSDSNTIASMIPVIDSSIVPVQGSEITQGLTQSAKLLKQAGFNKGQIILITDSTPSTFALQTAKQLFDMGYIVSVLAIGTSQGGPITNADGSFITDASGNVTLEHIDSKSLKKLAQLGGGQYVDFATNNNDVKQLLNDTTNGYNNNAKLQAKALWKDQGHWLIWFAIIFVAIVARKGWLEKIC